MECLFFLVTPSKLPDFKEFCTLFIDLTKLYYSSVNCRKGFIMQMTLVHRNENEFCTTDIINYCPIKKMIL